MLAHISIFRRGSPGPALSQRLELAGDITTEVHPCSYAFMPYSTPLCLPPFQQLINTPATPAPSLLPPTSTAVELTLRWPHAAVASLFPGPSVSGLAFAACLPLLQSRDTAVGRTVLAVSSTSPLLFPPPNHFCRGALLW